MSVGVKRSIELVERVLAGDDQEQVAATSDATEAQIDALVRRYTAAGRRALRMRLDSDKVNWARLDYSADPDFPYHDLKGVRSVLCIDPDEHCSDGLAHLLRIGASDIRILGEPRAGGAQFLLGQGTAPTGATISQCDSAAAVAQAFAVILGSGPESILKSYAGSGTSFIVRWAEESILEDGRSPQSVARLYPSARGGAWQVFDVRRRA